MDVSDYDHTLIVISLYLLENKVVDNVVRLVQGGIPKARTTVGREMESIELLSVSLKSLERSPFCIFCGHEIGKTID